MRGSPPPVFYVGSHHLKTSLCVSVHVFKSALEGLLRSSVYIPATFCAAPLLAYCNSKLHLNLWIFLMLGVKNRPQKKAYCHNRSTLTLLSWILYNTLWDTTQSIIGNIKGK